MATEKVSGEDDHISYDQEHESVIVGVEVERASNENRPA